MVTMSTTLTRLYVAIDVLRGLPEILRRRGDAPPGAADLYEMQLRAFEQWADAEERDAFERARDDRGGPTGKVDGLPAWAEVSKPDTWSCIRRSSMVRRTSTTYRLLGVRLTDYDFSALSPPDFEVLVADLLEADQNLRFEKFGPGRDHGIDLRCASQGTIVVQCKHYLRSGRRGLRRALADESEKWRGSNNISRYILASSVSMSVDFKDELFQILRPTLPVELGDIIGLEDMNRLLAKHPEVEKRHLKLWLASTAILERIVHSGLWVRSEDLLESIEARARFYVSTRRSGDVLKKLEDTNVCVISGGPGVGKSLLAEMTLLNHWQSGWQVVHVSEDMKEGFDAWNPLQAQIFYYDDFLGQTDLAETLGKNEDDRIAKFADKVARAKPNTKRLVLTTREQVLLQAEQASDRIRRANFPLATTVVQMGDYSLYTRGRILYNHLYFSSMSAEDRERLVSDGRYIDFIHHPNYSPRVVEQVLRRSANNLDDLYTDLKSTLDNPVELWAGSFHQLSPVARKALSVLLSFPPKGVSEPVLRRLIDPPDSFAYTQALKVLEGTWVKLSPGRSSSSLTVAFANPSCRDFLLRQADEAPAMAEELLRLSSGLEQLLLLFDYANPEPQRPSPPDSALRSAIGYWRTQRLLREIMDGKVLASQHSGLLTAITEDGADFVGRLRVAYTSHVSEVHDRARALANTRRLIDPRPDALLQILPVLQALGDDSDFIWFGQQLQDLTRDETGPFATPSSAQLFNLYVDCSFEPLIAESDRDSLLAAAVSVLDDREPFELFAAIAPHVGIRPELMTSAVNRLADLLESEYDAYRYDVDDPDEIRQAVQGLGDLARQFGLDFTDRGDALLERASELEEDVEEADSPKAPDEPGESAEDEDDLIRELFSSLTEPVEPVDPEAVG